MVKMKFRESNWVFSETMAELRHTESPVSAQMCASYCIWRELLPLSPKWALSEELLKKKKRHLSAEIIKDDPWGLPWWRSGWESACQCRGHGFEPWSGKIPHATEQLGPCAAITEPVRLEPVLHNKRGRDSERPAHRDEEWSPLAATRESPRTETKTQHSQK